MVHLPLHAQTVIHALWPARMQPDLFPHCFARAADKLSTSIRKWTQKSSNLDEGHHHHFLFIPLMLHQEDLAQKSKLVSKQGTGSWPFEYVNQMHPMLGGVHPEISYWQ